MRELRFLHPADDGVHLVVATVDGVERFALLAEPALRAATATAPTTASTDAPAVVDDPAAPPAVVSDPAPAVTPPVADAEIKPRDIQVRVRAGESPSDVAASLGVPVARIERFAAPVVEERQRIAGEARRARARRAAPEGAESKLVGFGDAVDERFRAHGVDPAEVAWNSWRRTDGDWVVEAGWDGGNGRHRAEWVFHRTSRTVAPLDDTASDLLSDRPIRPVVPPPPDPSLSSAPPLAPGVVAFPPMPDAHTGPLPKYDEVFDQDAAPEGPREVPPLVPAGADQGLNFDEPPLPLGITDPETRPAAAGGALANLANLRKAKRDESDEDRAARARVPSWDDILLGVRRKE